MYFEMSVSLHMNDIKMYCVYVVIHSLIHLSVSLFVFFRQALV